MNECRYCHDEYTDLPVYHNYAPYYICFCCLKMY